MKETKNKAQAKPKITAKPKRGWPEILASLRAKKEGAK
jgi:hypothetical protein